MSYKHITSDDRVRIATLLNEARNQSYIATRLGLSRSSISRELSRNAQQYRRTPVPLPAPPAILSIDGRRARGSGLAQDKHEARIRYDQAVREVRQSNRFYDSRYAHRQALTRRRRANHERQRLRYGANSQLEVHVREMLLSRQWSPEQICGDLRSIMAYGCRLRLSMTTLPIVQTKQISSSSVNNYAEVAGPIGTMARKQGLLLDKAPYPQFVIDQLLLPPESGWVTLRGIPLSALTRRIGSLPMSIEPAENVPSTCSLATLHDSSLTKQPEGLGIALYHCTLPPMIVVRSLPTTNASASKPE